MGAEFNVYIRRDASGLDVTGLNGTILLGFVRPDTTRFVYQGTPDIMFTRRPGLDTD